MARLSLQEASEVLVSLVEGGRTWVHVGPSYVDVSYGDAVFRTDDGWVIALHTSYSELKHTAYMISPDGRRGDERSWHQDARAAGKRTGDPMDGLSDPGYEYLERLAVEAPAESRQD